MRKGKTLFMFLLVFLMVAPLAVAKDSNMKLSLGGGFSLPTGNLDDGWKMGFNVGGTLNYRLKSNLYLIGDLQLNSFSLDKHGLDYDGGTSTITTLMAGAKYVLPSSEAINFYVEGGAGLAFGSVSDVKYGGVLLLEGDSGTDPAIMVGGGLEYKMNRKTTLFVEGRYVNVFDDDSYGFLPVRAGVTFRI